MSEVKNIKATYVLPNSFSYSMGGVDDELDERMKNVIELLTDGKLINSLNTFLDIGMGQGQVLKELSRRGKKCTGTGVEIDSYGIDRAKLKKEFNIDVVECPVESMPFQDKTFDGVIMSHILEHCLNVGNALKEASRVLKDNGWLFVFVPPQEDRVCAGHVSVGWNVGQLMYVLLMNGFNIKGGKFIKYGYNICGIVQKSKISLPPLRVDQGDIHILEKHGFFPVKIVTTDGRNDGYYGDILSINWDSQSEIFKKISVVPKNQTGILNVFKNCLITTSKFIPEKIKRVIALLLLNRPKDQNCKTNPTELKG